MHNIWARVAIPWLLFSRQAVNGQVNTTIESDTFFYGQSPPVYPTPNVTGKGSSSPWADSILRAQQLVDQMTLEEKVSLTSGVATDTGCSGVIPGVERLGFPGMCLTDAGNGVRNTDYVSSWPSGNSVGASWNRKLARQRAAFMGAEARKKGVNVLLGPVCGPLGRVARGGRDWEGFSNDPYLSGSLIYETVTGMQSEGVIASTKHWIANEQETHRLPTSAEPYVQSVSSNLDDATMHELYLWPFADAVRAGTGNIMCSLHRVNNSYACQNSKTINGLLKGELGYEGWVVTDWTGQHSGVASALAGLDVAMPNGTGYWEGNLTLAVRNGSVPESQVDNKAIRILASWFQMGQDQSIPTPGIGMPYDLLAPHEVVDARDPQSSGTLFTAAAEGHVLVKNERSALPLNSTKMRLISLYGYSAKAPSQNGPTPIPSGLSISAWSVGVESTNATEFSEAIWGDLSIPKSAVAINGTIVSGGGSGSTAQNLISSPYDALVQRALEDGTALFWDFESGDPSVSPTSDACIVVGNSWATEGYDRPAVRDDYTDGLILNVASKCSNTIVVFHNAGVRLVDQFADHPNVTAIIFAHLPGQQSGRALISILYGDINPSGRLTYTVARNESDYGTLLAPDETLDGTFEYFPQSDFDEGVFIDYRRFDAHSITPRYPFGFGLGYTTFSYSGLAVAAASSARSVYSSSGAVRSATSRQQPYPTGETVPGGPADLWDVVASVNCTVTNTGGTDGQEVAQLYVGIPSPGARQVPARQLRGYDKRMIAAGGSVTVNFELTRRDLSLWDVVAQRWLLQSGEYGIFVGSSSVDLPLSGTLVMEVAE